MSFRFRSFIVAGAALAAACLTAPSGSVAAPVSVGWNAATHAASAINSEMLTTVKGRHGRGGFHKGRGWHGGRAWGHSRGLKRGHYKRGYRRGGYYYAMPPAWRPHPYRRAYPF
jgi:hypothetical protein